MQAVKTQEDVYQQVKQLTAEQLGLDANRIDFNSSFVDLDASDDNLRALFKTLETTFEIRAISRADAQNIKTIADAVALIASRLEKKGL